MLLYIFLYVVSVIVSVLVIKTINKQIKIHDPGYYKSSVCYIPFSYIWILFIPIVNILFTVIDFIFYYDLKSNWVSSKKQNKLREWFEG